MKLRNFWNFQDIISGFSEAISGYFGIFSKTISGLFVFEKPDFGIFRDFFLFFFVFATQNSACARPEAAQNLHVAPGTHADILLCAPCGRSELIFRPGDAPIFPCASSHHADLLL
jgi:hypothetical protein